MFTATMSDTGESITGGTDMLSGILSIVYGCAYATVLDACSMAERVSITDVRVQAPDADYYWSITK